MNGKRLTTGILGDHLPPERHASFRAWLTGHRLLACNFPISALAQLAGVSISASAAYRLAVAEGLRGERFNRTRYAQFWSTVNWQLPDTDLSRIWGVSRQNLRARRARLGVGRPRWRLPGAANDLAYRRAVAREQRRSRSYRGPRPA